MRTPLRKALNVVAVFAVMIYLAPLYWITLTSIKPTKLINQKVPVWWFEPTGEHFVEAFERFKFDLGLIDSLIIIVTATTITMLLAVFSATRSRA